ncbi:hypothetical protein [Hyalangium gracile]|uniref:hypothetical protein n=1 Tax=Hyalangium gracile TaxID=394092 RepID=UPI001CCB8A69|nr:hypothetical protein [Hyalangium gracile]
MTRLAWMVLLLSSAASAQAPSAEDFLAKETDTAAERGSEPGADPWTVAAPTQLFSRPTLGEVFKVATEAKEEGAAFSLTASPGLLVDTAMKSQFLSGLQLVGAYSTEAKELTAGIKANYSFRDPRGWSQTFVDRLDATYKAELGKCRPQGEGEAIEAYMEHCSSLAWDALDKEVSDAMDFLPSFSLGLSTGYGFNSHALAKTAANLAVEVPFSTASIVLNGNLENAEVSEGRRRTSAGPALALTWKPTLPFRKKVVLDVSVAGKWTACLSECDEDSSSVEFGPRIGVPVTKDSVLAASVNWKGSGDEPFKPFLGLAFSHSFGIEKAE